MWPFTTAPRSLAFRRLDADFAVAGQITPDDVARLAEAGFKTIVCTRPDHEEPGQPSFATIAGEAERLGLTAVYIPVAGGIGAGQLQSMANALKTMPKPFLGYCRSGARAGSLYASARRVPA